MGESNLIRFGIIGTGAMARTMARVLARTKGVTVAGAASEDPARAADFVQANGLPRAYQSQAELLADSKIDAVYVANATRAHARTTLAALAAGKPVLCEKPFAANLEEAGQVTAAAEKAGVLLMEAIVAPFLPAIQAARTAVQSGGLGTVTHFSADFGYPATPSTHPRLFGPAGEGVLLDRAIYPVGLALHFLGPVERMQSSIRRDADGTPVHADLVLEHRNGARSQLTASLDSLLSNSAAIGCTRGSVLICPPLLGAEKIRITHAEPVAFGNHGGRLRELPLLRKLKSLASGLRGGSFHSYGAAPWQAEVEHFCELLNAGKRESPVMPLERSIAIQRILAAAGEAR